MGSVSVWDFGERQGSDLSYVVHFVEAPPLFWIVSTKSIRIQPSNSSPQIAGWMELLGELSCCRIRSAGGGRENVEITQLFRQAQFTRNWMLSKEKHTIDITYFVHPDCRPRYFVHFVPIYIYMFVNCLSSYCFPLYFGFWSVRAEQHTWYQVAWLSRRVTRTICCPLNRSKRFPRLMRCFHLRTEEPERYFLWLVVLHLLVVVHNVLVHKSHALGVGTFKSSSGSCGRRAAGHVGQFAKEEGKIQMIQQREMIEIYRNARWSKSEIDAKWCKGKHGTVQWLFTADLTHTMGH